jgi:hypothetical protein
MHARPTTSVWSISSLVTAILAPVFSCLCIPTMLFSIAAIVCGHKARGQILKSNGSKSGIGLATTGLVLGYLFLIISCISLPGFIKGFGDAIERAGNESTTDPGPGEALHKAEMLVMSDSNGLANGNNERAKELAREFGEQMKVLRNEMFSEAKGMDLTDGRFVTYCELHENSCLFISQAPMLRKFEDEAKDQLGTLAWAVAREITRNDLQPTDRLGVGLRGMLRYGQIRIGNHRDEVRPNDMSDKKESLSAFFPVEADAAADVAVDLENVDLTIDVDELVDEVAEDSAE